MAKSQAPKAPDDNFFDSEKFSQRFNELKKRQRYRQKDIASALGISRTAVYKWELGDRPSKKNLEKLAEMFGVYSDYLSGATDFRNFADECEKMLLPETKLIDLSRSLIESWIKAKGLTLESILTKRKENNAPLLIPIDALTDPEAVRDEIALMAFSKKGVLLDNFNFCEEAVLLTDMDIHILEREMLDYIYIRLSSITEQNYSLYGSDIREFYRLIKQTK